MKDTFTEVDDPLRVADVIRTAEEELVKRVILENTSTGADDPSGVADVTAEEEKGSTDEVEATPGTD